MGGEECGFLFTNLLQIFHIRTLTFNCENVYDGTMNPNKFSLTAKLQLIVDSDDVSALKDTMHAYTKACNFLSAIVFRTHDMERRHLHDLYYHQLRENFGIKAQMAQSVIKTVIARYKSILSNHQEWTKVKFQAYEYDLVYNRDYSFTGDGRLSVNTLSRRIKLSYHTDGLEDYFSGTWNFGTAKLVNKHNRMFLHVSVTCENPQLEDFYCANTVGIDRGLRFTAVTYDSKGKTVFYSGAQIKQKRAHYKRIRSSLQRKRTPSSRRRLKAIGHRENRWMRDVNHCVAKALVNSQPKHTYFVLEDLSNVREATECVCYKQRYYTVSWPYYDLEQKITYKARLHECVTVKVDPAYTSQTCPKCGNVNKKNRNKRTHTFKCIRCGYQSNDDRIAAMNLFNKGNKYLEELEESILSLKG